MSKPGPTLPFSVVPPPRCCLRRCVASVVAAALAALVVVAAAAGEGEAEHEQQDRKREVAAGHVPSFRSVSPTTTHLVPDRFGHNQPERRKRT